MADRAPLPGEFYLDAVVMDELRRAAVLGDQNSNQEDWSRPISFEDNVLTAAKERDRYVSLRWILNTSIGIPLEPFTVWRRPVGKREPLTTIPDVHQIGPDTWWWDGLTEMLLLEVDLTGPTVVHGLSRRDTDPVAIIAGGPGTVILQGGPMLGIRVDNPGAVISIRGLSVVTAANGDGWEPIERVGLPLAPALWGRSYYDGSQQGPINALTDPVTAAQMRLKNWGPIIGWRSLAGLPPWIAPDPAALVEEFGSELVPDLIEVMSAFPPPDLAKQRLAERPPYALDALSQTIGEVKLNTGAANYQSEITTRPLQAIGTAVATDTWASLTLGFGTGAPVGKPGAAGDFVVDDFMVTAPWQGQIQVAVPNSFPFPWATGLGLQPPPITYVSTEVRRELAAIVLSPTSRRAPGQPTTLVPATNFLEGASPVDSAYRVAVKVETPRPPLLPHEARSSAFGLARFDGPAVGAYRLRERRKAKGWIPIGSAAPLRRPDQLPDLALTDNTVMLRDNGVALPITGANLSYQYAAAATDLFGQWSPWSASWLSVGPTGVLVPIIAHTRATTGPGPGNTDPCSAQVVCEVVWDASERTNLRMNVVVDVSDSPPPPAELPAPPITPQAGLTAADISFDFSAAGVPTSVPAGVLVTALHGDDTPVTPVDPWDAADQDERRYRITLQDMPITYGSAREKLITVYVRAQERIRDGEWSAWNHAKESVLAPNPIPPPPHKPLPTEFPLWASLPDSAGFSFAPVSWEPSGAWRYRVYEATEAALLAACGRPGPVLTRGFGDRMQGLFDLYADPANREKLKSAYRKLGGEAILPVVHDGEMRFEALLPRGSSLIHCFIVVGVTESNVISDWPQPNAAGREGFLAYAIPKLLAPPMPQIQAFIGAGGSPEINIEVGGANPVTTYRIYRATNPVLARAIGTMTRLPDVAGDPVSWGKLTVGDPTAPTGWDRLQYRVVAVPSDDPDHAGMAIASAASKAFALLNPPPTAPPLSLQLDLTHTGLAVAVVRIDTTAPRSAKNVGDHALSWVTRRASVPDGRNLISLTAVPSVVDLPTFVSGPASTGYVGSSLYLKVDRLAGEPIALAVDLADPLARSSHALLEIEEFLPVPLPMINSFTLLRHNTLLDNAVWVGLETNVPLPPDPAHDWQLTVSYRKAVGIAVPSTRSAAISTLAVVAVAADIPQPSEVAAAFQIARIADTGHIEMWFRAAVAMRVAVTLTNSAGETITVRKVAL